MHNECGISYTVKTEQRLKTNKSDSTETFRICYDCLGSKFLDELVLNLRRSLTTNSTILGLEQETIWTYKRILLTKFKTEKASAEADFSSAASTSVTGLLNNKTAVASVAPAAEPDGPVVSAQPAVVPDEEPTPETAEAPKIICNNDQTAEADRSAAESSSDIGISNTVAEALNASGAKHDGPANPAILPDGMPAPKTAAAPEI